MLGPTTLKLPIKGQVRQQPSKTDLPATEPKHNRKIGIGICQRPRRRSQLLRMGTQMQTGPLVIMLLVSNHVSSSHHYITDIIQDLIFTILFLNIQNISIKHKMSAQYTHQGNYCHPYFLNEQLIQ